ncbi:metallophosphoesterase [Colwellia psychrerythraea]|uniref:Probable cyclic nucleotide phosphodiesterase CPS_4178 n=1 Tax=Colwellia psychrerythraea (strain 34H / ATCC BAA-681) TaxID=167879 RepID=CNPD3_COLP3|nr:metallophosphoesterase [Colwellia psychrerythraea]Q47WJ3.1 RecName: Full=Probable cyclic nucleotide phosphodiesterase CPS_4178 [Colwellia psychrerythraea 34H]AAZ26872.1 cyclic AMP phosphodiesterase [Colwellia psychrerythraea 34H]
MTITEPYSPNNQPITFAQITDSHLFSSVDGLHHGHNVLANLKKVLLSICDNPSIKYIIFTGDLTQDHTEQSYQNFVDCVLECHITVPIYYLAGNHDEPKLLDKYFSASPFQADKEINLSHWQVQLVDSKSATPAGYVGEQALVKLKDAIQKNKNQLLMMHHHPIDVGYFIDKHGLQNKDAFWQVINSYDNIKAIACGHVHGDMTLTNAITSPINEPVVLYTCPATSIQFDPTVDGVAALSKGPGYRLFSLYADGQLNTEVVML